VEIILRRSGEEATLSSKIPRDGGGAQRGLCLSTSQTSELFVWPADPQIIRTCIDQNDESQAQELYLGRKQSDGKQSSETCNEMPLHLGRPDTVLDGRVIRVVSR